MNLIETKSNNQKKLFSHDDLFLNLINLYDQKKLPNKIILSGSKGIGKATFAYHFTNYIFSKNEEFNYDKLNFKINDLNRSYNLVFNNSHPNFYLVDIIDDKKVIEINQIREMINYTNKSAFNNKERIVLIDNVENLNQSSSNALLKIIEEPNENVFFILIHDNSKKISETLNSRCLKFNIFLSFKNCIEVTNKIINNNVYSFINKNLINHYSTVGELINLVNFSQSIDLNIASSNLKDFLLNIIDGKHYSKDPYIKKNIYKYIEFYLFELFNIESSKKNISLIYENFIKKIYYLKKFNLDEESFFIEFKTKILNG